MICPLHAWGDESIRSQGLDAPAYLLGASIVDTDDVPDVRNALLALRPTSGKLHWHDLNRRERLRVTAAIGALDARHLVVVAEPMDPRREERARAICLERLGWELARRDVVRLTLEARSRRLMDRDLRIVKALRGRQVFPNRLRVDHGDPKVEPMLWLPDQVLGVFGDLKNEQTSGRGTIAHALEAFRVEP